MISTTSTPAWTGVVPVDDAVLAVTDSGGFGTPVIYLNGQFATQSYWRRVIAELGPDWRHITYDERARGRKSRRSADYSFEAAVRDVGSVLGARGVDRAVVVGWSYGAFWSQGIVPRRTRSSSIAANGLATKSRCESADGNPTKPEAE